MYRVSQVHKPLDVRLPGDVNPTAVLQTCLQPNNQNPISTQAETHTHAHAAKETAQVACYDILDSN